MMLQIESELLKHVTIMRLEGDIDEDGVKRLRIALVDTIREGRHEVVINLTGVKYISYMGVGVLVERLRQFRLHKGDMRLVGLNLYTQRLFRMVGVTNLFKIYENEAEAIEVLQEAA